jgi:hypothetical protein
VSGTVSRTRAAESGAGLVLVSADASPVAYWEFEVRLTETRSFLLVAQLITISSFAFPIPIPFQAEILVINHPGR